MSVPASVPGRTFFRCDSRFRSGRGDHLPDPVTTLKRLRKVEYAITTERVIVSSTSTNFSIPRSKAAPVQVIDEDGGVSTLIIGTEKTAKPSKLRPLGLTGFFVTENEKDVPLPRVLPCV